MKRIILHVDMDAYFASVERLLNHSLVGKPIAVIGTGKRTVVVSPSYEARRLGIKTGMSVNQAKKTYRDIVLVKAHMHEYINYSEAFIKILYDFTPLVEAYSIDEAFMDITGSTKLMGEPMTIARNIKQRILKELGLTCSIGIANNKLLAKIASDLHKPDSVFIIDEQYMRHEFPTLPVKNIPGIGPSISGKLNNMGVRTCGDLARLSLPVLQSMFGIYGVRLYNIARGIDDEPVIPFTEEHRAKCISHSMTLDQDCYDIEQIKSYILELVNVVCERMREEQYMAYTVGLTIRYNNFETVSYQKKLSKPTDLTTDVYKIALKLLLDHRLKMPVRLVGVSVSDFTRYTTRSLFSTEEKLRDALKTMDTVNKRFGTTALTFARLINNQAYRSSGSKLRYKHRF
ncbi:MAG: DNA polymerase IV [bacterium]